MVAICIIGLYITSQQLIQESPGCGVQLRRTYSALVNTVSSWPVISPAGLCGEAGRFLREDEDEKKEVIYCSCPEVKHDRKAESGGNVLTVAVSDFVDVLLSKGGYRLPWNSLFLTDTIYVFRFLGKSIKTPLFYTVVNMACMCNVKSIGQYKQVVSYTGKSSLRKKK